MLKEVEQQEDQWEERKYREETLEVYNYKRAAVHYLEAAIHNGNTMIEFTDHAHQLGTTNLTDVAKVPREIASELYEVAQVIKQ